MLKPGDSFDRYTIDSVLGQGGMGTVYRAHDTRLERRVALKVISDGAGGPDSDARLLREARAAAALDHPNAVSIFDVGELEGSPYIVMEMVQGRTLREALGGSVAVEIRAGWLADVGRALAAAHKRGLVHRDIKPENVMVRDDGVVKVLDFGIARRSQSGVDPSAPTQQTALPTLTKTGVNIGTPLYMAPEQIRSLPLDGRCDQFSWGVLAYETLTGKLPWKNPSDALAAVASILTDDVDPKELDDAGAPPEVAAIVMRALSKKADDRFASMDDLVAALDAALRGEALSSGRVAARRASSAPPPARIAEPRARIAAANTEPAPAPSATALQRFSTEDVREILSRAIDQQESKRADNRMGFDDLLAAAREVGVDEPTLREASRELRSRADQEAADQAFEVWKRKKRLGFQRHLGTYLVVSLVFVLFGLLTHAKMVAMLQVPLWWGIGIGIHAVRTFLASRDEWQEAYDRRMDRERKKRRRKEAVERAIDEGASLLLSTGAAIRERLAPSPPQNQRVRVDPVSPRPRVEVPTSTDARAEAEAVEEQEAARRRRS
jgi:eukaryotic-like serine/threonine-protein kinase